MPLLTLFAWALTACVAAVLARVPARVLRLQRLPTHIVSVLCAAAALALLALFRQQYQSIPVVITIDQPPADTQVASCRVIVGGTVSPSHARIGLAIRSERDTVWWVQPYVMATTTDGESGRWSVEALVGTEREGVGEYFQLVALASVDSVIVDVLTGRHVWRSLRPDDAPGPGCPEGYGTRVGALPPVSKSAPTVVRRVKG